MSYVCFVYKHTTRRRSTTHMHGCVASIGLLAIAGLMTRSIIPRWRAFDSLLLWFKCTFFSNCLFFWLAKTKTKGTKKKSGSQRALESENEKSNKNLFNILWSKCDFIWSSARGFDLWHSMRRSCAIFLSHLDNGIVGGNSKLSLWAHFMSRLVLWFSF